MKMLIVEDEVKTGDYLRQGLTEAGFAPAKVADIGGGTAVRALAAAAVLPEALIIASDIDRVAVDVAEAMQYRRSLHGG